MKKLNTNLMYILLLVSNVIYAQVDMTRGTLSFNIPLYSYSDNLTSLNFTTSLVYSSGNGLKVDEMSSGIGTGWDLSGIPLVSRVVIGLPDDQWEKQGSIYDTTKYPPGYLYNNISIASGCPVALTKYPIFHDKNTWYDNDNRTMSDRELDKFSVLLGNRSCSFVIDKNFHAIPLDDSRLKIEIITQDQRNSSHIRTSIKEFDITDESGIKYFFTESQITRLYKSQGSSNLFETETEIPLNQDPFVITGWFVSKIMEPKSGRFISFSYNTVPYRYQTWGDLKSEIISCNPNSSFCNIYLVNGNDPANAPYSIYSKPTGIIKKTEIFRKEVASVNFPNNFSVQFNYTQNRKDIAGASMLNSILVNDLNQQQLFKYTLTHGYFVKNEVKDPVDAVEEKWSRLCLSSVTKSGALGIIPDNPWKFEYYLGSNNLEDFVAPYFYHARDPWGYYNGNYAGVPTDRFLSTSNFTSSELANWSKVCLYNQPHGYFGGADIYYNVKTNYARNGLLKRVINPYGGATDYEYEQNYFLPNNSSSIYSFDHLSNGDMAIGGVHLSRIIKRTDGNVANDLITQYDYNDEHGHSSRWGEEPFRYSIGQNTYWQAAEKYFTGNTCSYYYLYPGNMRSTSFASDIFLFRFASLHDYLHVANSKLYMTPELIVSWVIGQVLNYVVSVIIECAVSSPPFKYESHPLIFSNPINNNQLPSQFKRTTVKEISGNNLQSGKIVYEFTSPDDFPLLLPDTAASKEHKPRCYDWIYGLPKRLKYIDNNEHVVKSVENEFELKKIDVLDPNTRSCNCNFFYSESQRADQWNTASNFTEFTPIDLQNNTNLSLKVDPYNIVTGHSELKKTTENIFDKSGSSFTTSTDYYYDPITHLLASQKSISSTGVLSETKNYYLENYDLSAASNIVLKQMKDDHILNLPISSEVWQTRPEASPEMLGCDITEYGITPSGLYRPLKKYTAYSDRPIPLSVIGPFNPAQLIRNNSIIKPVTEFTYDQYFGESLQAKNVRANKFTSCIYGTNERLPIANISNATKDEVAYTSFEPDGGWYTGNWSNLNVELLKEPSVTGEYCAKLNGNSSISTNVLISKNYKLSFWASSSSFQINGNPTPYLIGPNISGWTYYEYHLSPWSPTYVTISGNCKIDELRLHPLNASMVTTTYKQGFGKTSICDINNRINYYEYDEFGRLSKELDDRHNIIRTYEYHLKN